MDADEVFFHKYFSAVGKGREKANGRKERKKGKGVGSGDENGEEEDEEEIWKALVGSRPEIDGDGDEEGFDDDELDELDEGSDVDFEVGDDEEDGGTPVDVGAAQSDVEDDEMPDFLGDDNDSLLASDDDVPSHLLSSAFEREEEGQTAAPTGHAAAEIAGGKQGSGSSNGKNKERKQKRMKLKQLPTFAAADEYAGMLEGEEDGGV